MISLQTLEKLEYQKILEHISSFTSTEKSKKEILGLKPFDSLDKIKEEGNLVTDAKNILIEKDYPPFTYLPDLNDTLVKSRIEGIVLSVNNIRDVSKLASTSRKLRRFFRELKDSLINKKLAQYLFVDKVFEKHIDSVFSPSGEIIDSASKELLRIRKEIREKEEYLKKTVGKILKKLSDSYLVQEEYVTQRDGRIVLPVKAEHKRHVKGFIHSESATGQTVYIEPEETLELNNEILTLKFAEKREIERILKSLTKIIGERSYELTESLNIITKLDSLFAKAKYSLEIIGNFPSFDDSQPLRIIEGYHPILKKRLGHEKTVPLNLTIDKEKIIIITGPNAGGKTVVLKTVGILIAMAQSGIHIPAHADTNLHYFRDIFIDIGDEQSIENDLSTFSSHLSNLNFIVQNASAESLVLLDEIGTGTDPAEGSALATAILLRLLEIGATVLATTHHGNLKLLATAFDGIQNASMKFDTENLVPTYEFYQGLPGSSYAFEVAKKIGLSKEIISDARNHLDSDKSKLEDFLLEIEKKSNELTQKLRKLELENTRLKGLTNLYQSKIEELQKKQKEILQKTEAKAESFLTEINKSFEQTVKRIRESSADKKVIKEEKQKLTELKQKKKKYFRAVEETTGEPQKFKPGDYARIKDSTTSGEILEIDEDKQIALLLSGSLKLKVKLNSLVPDKKIKQEKPILTKNYSPEVETLRLDIRGEKPEDIEHKLLKYLDNAYAANLERVEILHGKGTGVLKSFVKSVLENHPKVKKFYFADIESGGDGVTIVEFEE